MQQSIRCHVGRRGRCHWLSRCTPTACGVCVKYDVRRPRPYHCINWCRSHVEVFRFTGTSSQTYSIEAIHGHTSNSGSSPSVPSTSIPDKSPSIIMPVIKKKPSGVTPVGKFVYVPKRGKVRAMKRPSCSTTSKKKVIKKAKYTRRSETGKAVRKWCVDYPYLTRTPTSKLMTYLRQLGLVRRLSCCPRCGGRLHKLYRDPVLQGRCTSKGCQFRLNWLYKHPLLWAGSLSLNIKTSAILGCLLGGLSCS